jgi:hypothetical protein
MSKLITQAALAAKFAARYPNSGVLDSVSASAGRAESIEAAGVRPFAAVGKLVVIKATEHFYVAGELVPASTPEDVSLVEVSERDAASIIADRRAVLATDEDIAAANKPAKAAK